MKPLENRIAKLSSLFNVNFARILKIITFKKFRKMGESYLLFQKNLFCFLMENFGKMFLPFTLVSRFLKRYKSEQNEDIFSKIKVNLKIKYCFEKKRD